MKADHRCCRYHPEKGARTFEPGEDIPDGWFDTPMKFPESIDQMTPDERAYYFGVWGWKKDVKRMGKQELEEYAREKGIELDRRKTLKNMLKDFEAAQ